MSQNRGVKEKRGKRASQHAILSIADMGSDFGPTRPDFGVSKAGRA